MARIVGAPGFEDFTATLLFTVSKVDWRGELAMIRDENGELFVIPAEFVQEEEED